MLTLFGKDNFSQLCPLYLPSRRHLIDGKCTRSGGREDGRREGGREGGRTINQTESGEETEDGAKKRERERGWISQGGGGGLRSLGSSERQVDITYVHAKHVQMCTWRNSWKAYFIMQVCGAPKRPESQGVEKGGGYCGGGSKIFNMEDKVPCHVHVRVPRSTRRLAVNDSNIAGNRL